MDLDPGEPDPHGLCRQVPDDSIGYLSTYLCYLSIDLSDIIAHHFNGAVAGRPKASGYSTREIIPASTQNMSDGIKTGSKAGGNDNFEGGQALWAKLGATLGAMVTSRSGKGFGIPFVVHR